MDMLQSRSKTKRVLIDTCQPVTTSISESGFGDLQVPNIGFQYLLRASM